MGGCLGVGIAASALAAPATQRPIGDFVSTQGTFCIDDGASGCFLFAPPVANSLGQSDPQQNLCMLADNAGLADAWISVASAGAISFGTQADGTITEKPLTDGRAEVTVRLHTANALTWVIDGCDDFGTNPLLFGNRAQDVLNAGAEPALGDVSLQVRFINTAPGAPMPDLLQLIIAPEPGQEFPSFLSFNVRATGRLHSNFGVAEGTPGRAESIQTGLFMTRFMGATADGFPAEQINLSVVGH